MSVAPSGARPDNRTTAASHAELPATDDTCLARGARATLVVSVELVLVFPIVVSPFILALTAARVDVAISLMS